MNLQELGRALGVIGIDPRMVALGGRADLSGCIERTNDEVWEVFWYERGKENNPSRLTTETQACFELLGRLPYSQILAGAICVDTKDQL